MDLRERDRQTFGGLLLHHTASPAAREDAPRQEPRRPLRGGGAVAGLWRPSRRERRQSPVWSSWDKYKQRHRNKDAWSKGHIDFNMIQWVRV